MHDFFFRKGCDSQMTPFFSNVNVKDLAILAEYCHENSGTFLYRRLYSQENAMLGMVKRMHFLVEGSRY